MLWRRDFNLVAPVVRENQVRYSDYYGIRLAFWLVQYYVPVMEKGRGDFKPAARRIGPTNFGR